MGKTRQDEDQVRPFQFQGNYFATHKAVVDFIMPTLSGSETKILWFIIRHTTQVFDGFHSFFKPLSYSRIQAGTGIRHPATVADALAVLCGEEKPERGRKAMRKAKPIAYLERIPGSNDPNNFYAASYRLRQDLTINIPKGYYSEHVQESDDAPLQKMKCATSKNEVGVPLQKMKCATSKNEVYKRINNHEINNHGEGKQEIPDLSVNSNTDLSVRWLIEFAEREIGHLPDRADQETAARWLVESDYDLKACAACFCHYQQRMDFFKGWLTVRQYIGTWSKKRNGKTKPKSPSRPSHQPNLPVVTFPVEIDQEFRQQLYDAIKTRLNQQSFEEWFLPITQVGRDGETIYFGGSRVFCDWINNNYLDLIEEALEALNLGNYSIRFLVTS